MKFNLLETIKIVNGEVLHLSYHQTRLENGCKQLQIKNLYSLCEIIQAPKEGTFRCRFVYNDAGYTIEYIPYNYMPINSLKLINCEDFDYSLKYENREKLDTLFSMREECDDILITTNEMLRDTTKANIALFDGSSWYTPKDPLLAGTTRARYLDQKKVIPKTLYVNDISNFQRVAVLNAMVDFCIVKDGIIS